MSVSPRHRRAAALAAVLALTLGACGTDQDGPPAAPSVSRADIAEADRLADVVRQRLTADGLASVVYGVWRGDERIALGAVGESPIGLPAAADMRLRVGQPMEPMLSTVLWKLDAAGTLDLDAPIARWLPTFPRADRITPRMLADSTSGIADYVTEPEFLRRFGADPFHTWTAAELLDRATARPPLFEPGTDFAYAHSDLVVLGEVLQQASGRSLGELIAEHVLRPLGMDRTAVVLDAQLLPPILHAYTTERGVFENSTFWNPTAFLHSGNMNSTVADVGRWVGALGTGELLSPEQHRQMMGPSTAGLGPFTPEKYFAFGVVHLGDWLYMNPSYGGYDGVAYHDTRTRTTIVAYAISGPATDANQNSALPVGAALGTALDPNRPPPTL
ncbi:serine hydrolase domain-containing protein [Nocardia thailandica]